MHENKGFTHSMRSLKKLSNMHGPIIEVKKFFKDKLENSSLCPRSVEEILVKQYGKMYYGNTKNFHIFNFSPKG